MVLEIDYAENSYDLKALRIAFKLESWKKIRYVSNSDDVSNITKPVCPMKLKRLKLVVIHRHVICDV